MSNGREDNFIIGGVRRMGAIFLFMFRLLGQSVPALGRPGLIIAQIYNAGGQPVNLTGYSLYLVNGIDDTTYSIVDLSSAGSLAAGQYLVVGDYALTVPAGVKTKIFSAAWARNRMPSEARSRKAP